jgi:outer membrane receptor protein involved in Fe transport
VHITPQFDVELGGRESHNKQSAHQITSGVLAGVSDLTAHSSESVFTYSVAPKYKINPNASIYARVAKGFRPGGPNVLPPGAPPQFATYHSDSLVSYEVGFKAESADHRLSFDGAAFHIDWKNIQLFAVESGFGFNANGSTAKSDGFELTAAARPIPGLDLSANAAYTNARLTGPTPDTVGGRKGDQLPFTPKFAGSLNADYQWLIGGGTTAHFGGSFRHLSGQTAPYDTDFVAAFGRQRHIPAYDVIDLNAGVNFGHWDIQAYVKNLGDSRGITSVTGLTVFGPPGHPDAGFPLFPGGAIGTGIIRPRTVGITVGFQY